MDWLMDSSFFFPTAIFHIPLYSLIQKTAYISIQLFGFKMEKYFRHIGVE